MPTYDYRCKTCRASFTVTLSVKQHDAKKIKCPKCGSQRVTQKVSNFFAVTSRKA